MDDIFAYVAALNISEEIEDHEPRSIYECKNRNDWPKWKEAIEAELKSLKKCQIFGHIVQTPGGIKPVGYRWVFVRKKMRKMKL